MRCAIQADGGDLQLVSHDVEAGKIEVQLTGACSSCAISSVTLSGGVERILRERLSWVTEIKSGLDESVDPLESSYLGKGSYVPAWSVATTRTRVPIRSGGDGGASSGRPV